MRNEKAWRQGYHVAVFGITIFVVFSCANFLMPPSNAAGEGSKSGSEALKISTTSLPNGQRGTSYSATLSATGGETPYTWSVAGGSLPAGLSLNSSTGAINGMPSTIGNSSFTVQVKGGSRHGRFSNSASASFNISISTTSTPVSISTTSLPSGQQGTSYSSSLSATGGTAPYSWAVASGSLPAGLSLSTAGAISGMPSSSGTSSFTVQVTDSSSPALTATASLSIAISGSTLSITTTSLPNGTVSSSYSSTLAATGGVTPYTWSVSSGSLPAGLSLNASTGAISGTPTTAGTSTVGMQVRDSEASPQTAGQSFSVTVSSAVSGTAVSECESISSAGTYTLQSNVSATGTCFTITVNGVTINLNGYTVSYGSSSSGNGFTISMYNNTGLTLNGPGNVTGGSAGGPPLNTPGSYNFCGGPTIQGITFTWGNSSNAGGDSLNYGGCSVTSGANIYNNTFNNNSASSCAEVSCRDLLQGTTLFLTQAWYSNSGVHSVYNNTFNGGVQGAIACDAPGCLIYGNTGNPGESASEFTDDFFIYCWSSCNAYNNTGLVNVSSPHESRGVEMSGVDCEESGRPGCAGRNVHNNTILAVEHPNNNEYSGCELGGAFGISWSGGPDSATANSTAQNNNVTAYAYDCQAIGLRITDSSYTSNLSTNNTYIGEHSTSAGECVPASNVGGPGCAYALGFDMGADNGNAFSDVKDTFQADDAEIFFDDWGASGTTLVSPTFLKGTYNPQSDCSGNFCFMIARNDEAPVTLYIQDATFGAGVDPDYNQIPAQGTYDVELVNVYLTFTQTVTVTGASGSAVSGATVTYTDALGNHYTATTNSSGVASIVVTTKDYTNASTANGIVQYNPFGLTVSSSGCTTNSQSGLTISTTGSTSVTLGGC